MMLAESRAERLAGILSVDHYQRASEALIIGIDRCAEERVPLSQVQQVHLLAVAFACVDGAEHDIADTLGAASILRARRFTAHDPEPR